MDRPPPPPPPPPPHAEHPKTTQGEYRRASDLPDGRYDIFIIPPHSSGAGFLYLPSLKCHRNSFIAGSLSTLCAVLVWRLVSPLVKIIFLATASHGWGMGAVFSVLAVGAASGWAIGRNVDRHRDGGSGRERDRERDGGSGRERDSDRDSDRDRERDGDRDSGRDSGRSGPEGPFSGKANANADGPYSGKANANADWDRAREETRRKEDLRRKMEEFKRKREAEQREKQRQREREAMEQELKERREQLEREIAAAREAAAREAAAAKEKAEREAAAVKEKAEREAAAAKEKAERAAAEAREKELQEAAAKEAAKKEADAKFKALKEAAAKRYAEKKASEAASASSPTPAKKTAQKTAPAAAAATAATDDDDAYSFRPYDRPRRPYNTHTHGVESEYSASTYAPSQSTARTSPPPPPPSNKGPYSTKDPDKVVLCGAYTFNNAFLKTPIAQLASGKGPVTDGLILRITTEGLFIDDDIRGIPQREWDVKAWTMKTVENAELRGLYVLRASIRDQEGKRYVFVLQQTEGWKVAVGLQRLRKGSQTRALSISSMPAAECKSLLASLGYI